jgi:hypothetical protein
MLHRIQQSSRYEVQGSNPDQEIECPDLGM